MKVGLRRSMVTGGAIFGTAWGLSALGVSMHNLPLLYAGNCEFFCFFLNSFVFIDIDKFSHYNFSIGWHWLWILLHPSYPSND